MCTRLRERGTQWPPWLACGTLCTALPHTRFVAQSVDQAYRLQPEQRPALRALIEEHGLVLLYDGVCGLCNGFVQFILRHDRHGTLRFATLQGTWGAEAARVVPNMAQVDSVVLLSRDGASIRSTVALEVARYLGGVWTVALVGYLVPRVWRDAIYDWVARRRYRWFGKLDACQLPLPEHRVRFLD